MTITDLEENLPLLKENCQKNLGSDKAPEVRTLKWGGVDASSWGGPFDIVFATDVLYIREVSGFSS